MEAAKGLLLRHLSSHAASTNSSVGVAFRGEDTKQNFTLLKRESDRFIRSVCNRLYVAYSLSARSRLTMSSPRVFADPKPMADFSVRLAFSDKF